MFSTNAMAPTVARSSLEIMLDAIRQSDERPKDLPPALPARPTSKGRLPTSRRSMPSATRRLLNNSIKLEDKEEEQTLRNDKDVVLKVGIFGSKRIAKTDQTEESPYMMMPELVSYEERVQVADVPNLPVVPLPSAVVLGKNMRCGGTINYAMSEVAGSEDARNQSLQRILWVQKNVRGLQARSQYLQLKKAAADLQSFVQGERARRNFEVLRKRWRAAVVIQKHVRRWFARTVFNDQQKNIILLQSVIRGWLARKHFTVVKKMEMSIVSHTVSKNREKSKIVHVKLNRKSARDPPELVKDTNNEHHQIHPSVLEELQNQVLKAEAALREKEEENSILKQQLQEYETRWSKYELKMKSMEETWQKQLTSLQMNFAARKSLAPKEMTNQPARLDTSQINHCHNSEDTISAGAQALEGTLAKLPNASDAEPIRNNYSAQRSVIQLVEEFDQQRQIFNDDAGFLIEVKSGKFGANINACEDLRKLKARFASWKKDYKIRLRDTKKELLKFGNLEEKAHKKWWCTVSTR